MTSFLFRPPGRWLCAILLIASIMAAGSASAGEDVRIAKAVSVISGAAELGGSGHVEAGSGVDLLLGRSSADPLGRRNAGAVFVAAASRGSVSLWKNRFHGFRIAGAAPADIAAESCVVGDLNGDGLDEVAVGAPGADTRNGTDSGAAYVIYGAPDPTDVDLETFSGEEQSDAGFRIDGGSASGGAGSAVACVGDVNGDDLGDVAVASPGAGATYVVFGKAATGNIDLMLFDLGAQGDAGFRIETPVPRPNGVYAVGGGGDTNGDGLSDVLIGLVRHRTETTGLVYVVFGKSDPVPVDTTSAETSAGHTWGYRILGQARGWLTGESVADAGDVNGDGLDDVLVGASRRTVYRAGGRAYVVFGSEERDEVILGELGTRGFAMIAGPERDAAGAAVAAAGDIDGDGLADLLVGAPLASVGGRTGAGLVYVVKGAASSDTVRMRELGRRGYRILGRAEGANIGGDVGAYRTGSEELRFLVSSYPRRKTYVVPARTSF